LPHLVAGSESRADNLGNGQGFSVKEVVNVVEKVSGKKLPVKYGPRRAGDPPRLVADAGKIRNDWGWSPKYGDLEEIIRHAWLWEVKGDDWDWD
jgi:UDP-glucose 4-epimerase